MAGTSALIKAVVPEGTSSCVLHHKAISVKSVPGTFRNLFDLILLNLIPFSMYLLNILWDGN